MKENPQSEGSNLPKRKVFSFGFPKTGTTTLQGILIKWGYRPAKEPIDRFEDYRRGNLDVANLVLNEADCFRVLPWVYLYEEMFNRFGDSAQYVLTTRLTPEKWIDSLKAHAFRYEDKSNQVLQFGSEYPHGREAEHIALYNAHNTAVRDFFARAGASHLLLDVCWEAGHGWPEICAYFSRPIPDEPFPNLNGRETFPYNPSVVMHNQRRIDERMGKSPPSAGSPR